MNCSICQQIIRPRFNKLEVKHFNNVYEECVPKILPKAKDYMTILMQMWNHFQIAIIGLKHLETRSILIVV